MSNLINYAATRTNALKNWDLMTRASPTKIPVKKDFRFWPFHEIWSSPRKEKNSKPPRGENWVPCEQTIKVNPQRGKTRRNPDKESPRIANNKSDPNGQQKELVPRRPRKKSNKNPSGSKSAVTAKSKGDPRKESPFKLYAQLRSEWAPKGNKFLSACRNFLCTVGFLRRSESEQKGNHSEASAREICSSGISWRTVQLPHRSKLISQRWIKNPELETMKENI